MATEEHYPVSTGALGGRYVTAKLGKQRKARKWLVQATNDDRIIVQGEGAIGIFAMDGKGKLCTTGGYFPHLALARPFEFPAGFVAACLDVCQPLDAETSYGGVTVAHTVQVVG